MVFYEMVLEPEQKMLLEQEKRDDRNDLYTLAPRKGLKLISHPSRIANTQNDAIYD